MDSRTLKTLGEPQRVLRDESACRTEIHDSTLSDLEMAVSV